MKLSHLFNGNYLQTADLQTEMQPLLSQINNPVEYSIEHANSYMYKFEDNEDSLAFEHILELLRFMDEDGVNIATAFTDYTPEQAAIVQEKLGKFEGRTELAQDLLNKIQEPYIDVFSIESDDYWQQFKITLKQLMTNDGYNDIIKNWYDNHYKDVLIELLLKGAYSFGGSVYELEDFEILNNKLGTKLLEISNKLDSIEFWTKNDYFARFYREHYNEFDNPTDFSEVHNMFIDYVENELSGVDMTDIYDDFEFLLNENYDDEEIFEIDKYTTFQDFKTSNVGLSYSGEIEEGDFDDYDFDYDYLKTRIQDIAGNVTDSQIKDWLKEVIEFDERATELNGVLLKPKNIEDVGHIISYVAHHGQEFFENYVGKNRFKNVTTEKLWLQMLRFYNDKKFEN